MEDYTFKDTKLEDRFEKAILEISDIMIENHKTSFKAVGVIPNTNIKQTVYCELEELENLKN